MAQIGRNCEVKSAYMIATVALALLCCTAAAPPPRDDDATIRRIMTIALPSGNGPGPGCAVGVQRGDASPIVQSSGFASLEEGIPIGDQSVFAIASTTKQFTAAAILILQHEGKLQLSDSIRRYLPELPPYSQAITILALLQHTSGIRDYNQLLSYAGGRQGDHWSQDDALAIIALQKKTAFAPGTAYLYSNSNFVLAAEIVRRVSGLGIRAFAEKHIFQPLGMAHTQYVEDHDAVILRRTRGYRRVDEGGPWLDADDARDVVGPGGIVTTASDLLLWGRALREGKLDDVSLTPLEVPGLLADGSPIRVDGTSGGYGLGLEVGGDGNGLVYHHGGDSPGFASDIKVYPKLDLTIVALCNQSGFDAERLTTDLAQALLPSLGNNAPAVPLPIVAASNPLDGYVGTYTSSTRRVARVVIHDGGLALHTLSSHFIPLKRISDGVYSLDDGGFVRFALDRRARMRLELLTASQIQGEFFQRVTLNASLPTMSLADLQDRFGGRYISDELYGKEWRVAANDGKLLLDMGSGKTQTLRQAYDGVFSGSEGEMIEFVSDVHGKVIGLAPYGYDQRAPGVWFARRSDCFVHRPSV